MGQPPRPGPRLDPVLRRAAPGRGHRPGPRRHPPVRPEGIVIVRAGKGGTYREVPVHPQLRPDLALWINDERPAWKGSARTSALLLNHRGARLGARGADGILGAIADEAHLTDEFTTHVLRHTFGTTLERRGVASDAMFRVRREDGAVGATGPGATRRPSRRQGEPAGQDGRDRTVWRQMPRCCVHSGCIRRKHDAARATKNRSDEGRCHYRPVVTLPHSAGLVNRSLPVGTPASTAPSSPCGWAIRTSGRLRSTSMPT